MHLNHVHSPANTADKPLRILSLEDNTVDTELLSQRLETEGFSFKLTGVDNRPDFLKAIKEDGPFDLILSDYSMPGFSGRDALILAREECPQVPFIFFSGTIGEERAVEGLKIGAADFVLKDRPSRLSLAIRRALEDSRHRRQLEEAQHTLRATEALFRALVEQSLVGVYVLQDWRFAYANQQMEQILGYTPEELATRSVLDLATPNDRRLVEQNVQKRLSGAKSSVRYQLQAVHKKGFIVDVEVHGSYTMFAGKPAIMGVMLDITERKRKEEQIRDQATLLDKALNAILVCDLSGVIRYWNDGACRLYGWPAKEAVGQFADTLLLKSESQASQEALKRTVEHGDWSGEFRHTTKSGAGIDIESHWSLIRDDEQNPKSVLIVNIDVTEKKKADAQARRSQRLDSIGALAGGIAHDLNNVLSPLLMALTLLQDEVQTNTGHKLVEILDASCRRGAEMVKQILLFARGAEGERRIIQLQHLLGELAKVLQQMFPRNVRVEVRQDHDLWPVMGDATQLHQVFMNLCVNARDAMPEGGLLRIEATNTTLDDLAARMFGEGTAGSYVMITVSDTGTGIPPEIMEKIFEPFFTTKEVGKGTGLGLSTVAGIVKGQGGFVKVYSELGRGTSFRVYLPAANTAELQQQSAAKSQIPLGRGEKVLLVDDELALREITKAALEKHGYVVRSAADGAEAIALYAQHKDDTDIVITDMTMPVVDGPATIYALKRMNPDVKIIAVSGLMVDLKTARLDSAKNVQFLAKPFDTEKLLTILHKSLSEKNSSEN